MADVLFTAGGLKFIPVQFRRSATAPASDRGPGQTNTDLSRLRLEESGFGVKRVALAAMGASRLSRPTSPARGASTLLFLTDLSARHAPLYFDITHSVTYFWQLPILRTFESRSDRAVISLLFALLRDIFK